MEQTTGRIPCIFSLSYDLGPPHPSEYKASLNLLYRNKRTQGEERGEPLWLSQLTGRGKKDPNKTTTQKTGPLSIFSLYAYRMTAGALNLTA
jgi:hypothetical protein